MFGKPKFFPKGTVQNLANNKDKNRGDMRMQVPFDHYITSGEKALKLMADLRASDPESLPFIAGDAFSLSRLLEIFEISDEDGAPSAQEIIVEAESFDIHEWLSERETEYRSYAEEDGFEFPPNEAVESKPEPQSGLIGNLDVLSSAPIAQLFVGVLPVPVAQSWKSFSHLRYGNWNECPPPAVHCALHKYWVEKYGVTLATVAFDTVEVMVSKPASTVKEAEELAMQQYLYCNDIIDQGYGSFDALAASLLGAKTWWFWWD